MLISICTACHNRTYDLKKTLPTWIEASEISPPVEIVVLDYNSPDDLQEYIKSITGLSEGVILRCPHYNGKDHYHMAHAKNLSVLAVSAKYYVHINSDCYMKNDFILKIRELFEENPDLGWATVYRNEGIIAMRKQDFIDAGGYDERFEFYGPEDKDLNSRLARRGLSVYTLPLIYAPGIATPNIDKVKNYRLPLTKHRMKVMMAPIYQENIANNILIANEGKEWGVWTN
jgi:GT2 family glycosyltransferase